MFKRMAAGAMAFAAIAGSTVAASTPAVAAPVDVVPSGAVTLDVASVNGSGCPRGTASVDLAEDKKAFTITYSAFEAATGRDANSREFRKNCQLALDVNVPQGFTWAIYSADYRGFASLSDGATGYQSANYYWQGHSNEYRSENQIDGEYEGNWRFTDRAETIDFLPCSQKRNLNINQELRVKGSNSDKKKKTTSLMTLDSTDVDVSTVFNIAWRRC